MASITTDPNGRRRISFAAADGKRKTLRLGKVSKGAAEKILPHVDELISASIHGHAIQPATAAWLEHGTDLLSKRLAGAGLIPKRETATLAAFIDAYIASRSDTKPATAIVYGNTRRCLVEYFGANKPLRDITPGDADAWRLWLAKKAKKARKKKRR